VKRSLNLLAANATKSNTGNGLENMLGLTKNDLKGLWAVLWRSLILGPVIWILGTALLTLVIAAFFVPPIYAVLAFYTGDWLVGILALITWFVFLHFRRPILRWTLQGIEFGVI